MKTTIDRVGRIRRVALALWRRLNPSSAADDGPRSFEEAQPPGLTPAPEFWAGRWFDDAERHHRYHYAISGAPRSGKSLLLALYLRSVISQITPGSDRRLVIFDHNQMLHPALFENVQVPVHFFLPNHRLTSRWGLAGGDFASPAAVTQLCEALVPEVRGYGSIFFVQIARRLMADVIHSLNATQPGWSLADVVRILENQDSTADILARSNGTSSLLRYMDEPRTWANIAATEETHLGTPRDLAAMWSRASQTFSLRDFVRSEGILVLGRDPGFPALDRLNMLLFTQLFSQLLAQSDSATSRTHVVLDELPLAAGDRRPLSGLKDICERGASRGVVLAVTFRSYADMKALYQHDADAILCMLQNKIFLRAPDVPTAKYASEAFRKWHEWIDVSGEYHVLDAVPYEKFLELPSASPKDGITGYCLRPRAQRSPEVFHLPWHWVEANLPKGR